MRRKQKSVLWLSLTLSLILLASISATAQEALLLRYSFNEGVGDRVRDVSGNENNAIMHNMDDTSWVEGKEGRFGTCLVLDGIDDYLTTDGFFSEPLDGDFTLSMWFTGTPGRRARLFQFRTGDAQMLNVRIIDDILSIDDHGGVQAEDSGDVSVTDQQWHHFAIVRSGLSLIAYLDGEQHMETSLQEVVAMDNVSIGVRDRTGTQDDYLPGKVDEFSIYAEALDIDKIRFLMENLVFAGEKASNPDPTDQAEDVPWDVTLSWTPGEYAPPINGHTVYLSESFNDVNDGIGGVTQSANSYARPQRLDFGTTYYWRVDEVNGPPDYTVYKGDVWQFKTEPFAYPLPSENITATASSTGQEDMGPENTINGSGLYANDLHSTEATDMWLSSSEPNGAWIEYELDKVHKLHEMWVWNSNQMMEPMVGLGFKDVSIEYSVNGTDYTTLGTTHEFARAPGTPDYAHNTTIDFSGATAKYVRLTANSNWGGFMPQYGLSEVRFFSIPVYAREPSPDSGATDVDVDVTLGFRAGREAAEHNVYLSTDEQAVIDGNAPVTTVTETSYGPLSLDLGTTYYWKINEVNEAETTTTWQGEIWNFSTPEFFVVDDFEDYNDYPPNEIWATWVDGYGVPTNGATAGYPAPDFLAGEHYVETTIVHGGEQAMPFFYDNTGAAAYSEGERTFAVPQDWTAAGVQTLAMYFYGTPGNTGQLYVKVNGSKVVYDGDASNLARAGWQPWNIELASFGVSLQSVTTLGIGIDGSGASGTLYFDDIRLYSYSRQFVTPAEPNNVGLVAHYKLDQDATDSSGNNNHGTLVGDPQWAVGKISSALDFDGDDNVDFGNPSLLDFGTDSWSISAWINMPASTDQMIIFSKGGDSGGGIRYMLSMGETDDHKAVLTLDDNANKIQSTGSITVDDGQWHHIVGMRDGNMLRVYVDGVQDGAPVPLPDGYDLSGTSQANAYIGAGWNYEDSVVQKYFIGVIDDVRIYDYVLSHAEVAWLSGMTLPFDKPF